MSSSPDNGNPSSTDNSGSGDWKETLNTIRRSGEVVKEIKTLLGTQPSRFTFETLLDASNGAAIIVRETLPNGEERKFVLKAAANCTDASIRAESAWVNRLEYAAHVSNPIHLSNTPLLHLGAPYFIAEYLPHGTLVRFQERAIKAKLPLPNRILWSIFLCLVRGCIAMAYPPKGPDTQLEHTRDEEPSRLTHNDMHGANFVFGMVEKTRLLSRNGTVYLHEHAFLPPLKLIDFGLASETGPQSPRELNQRLYQEHDVFLGLPNLREPVGRRHEGTDFNILDIGVVMARVMSGHIIGQLYEARIWSRSLNVRPDLDPDLRLLIQACLAVDPLTRPRLEEFNTMINNGLFNKTAEHYGAAGQGDGPESDATLRRIVSTCILDADVS
ncbi:uncharacterized protein GGS22DRAFT_196436 [Annulohypoxylon maeteangense]|uniref:uncharacterized protein n=1 Tax=Annulohypoxylon maeteangense TaxID=1927788 RepID=UPI002008E251|nr:uncharacterized protein GGS22DRAFT_196436 [Annulohypoxylon maeteangense]KAI0881488.1 hypothetical protein GGS22DRAFT_196436 [Annulohypoxylon maeteangense]